MRVAAVLDVYDVRCVACHCRDVSFRIIFTDKLIVLLIIGGMVRYMAGYAIASYLPDFYSEIYPDDNTVCE